MGKTLPTADLITEKQYTRLSLKNKAEVFHTLTPAQLKRFDFFYCQSLHKINLKVKADREYRAKMEEQYRNASPEERLAILPDLTPEQAESEPSYYEAESLARINRVNGIHEARRVKIEKPKPAPKKRRR